MEIIVKINDFVNGIVWGVPLMVLIIATGIYFTIRLGFLQFAKPGLLFRETVKKAFKKKDEENHEEESVDSHFIYLNYNIFHT